ncbi:MAG: sensor histidine kinase, partial [Leucobacter sp.]
MIPPTTDQAQPISQAQPVQRAQPIQRVQPAPLRPFQTLLHLALVGTVGWGVIATFLSLLGTGIGLVPVLGIGFIILAGLIYAMFGVAWFETARVGGLYNLEVTAPAFARRT